MEIEQIVKLIQTVSASNLSGFTYEEDGVKVALEKKPQEGTVVVSTSSAGAVIPQETAASPAGSPAEQPGYVVTSLLVGTFYAAPAEDAAPFVTVGDMVKKGQTIGIVEAMKLMNDVESEADGQIAEIYVQNGQMVEYGQPLFRIV